MSHLVANFVLSIVWVLFFGSFTWLTAISGLVVGYALLWLLRPVTGSQTTYFMRVWYWLKLVIMFHYELVVSSMQVLWDIVTPTHWARPAIIEIPLDVKTDTGILLVTNLISLTPGTLSLDVSEDRSTLTVHAMFADDPDAVRHALKNGMERWVIDAVEGRE